MAQLELDSLKSKPFLIVLPRLTRFQRISIETKKLVYFKGDEKFMRKKWWLTSRHSQALARAAVLAQSNLIKLSFLPLLGRTLAWIQMKIAFSTLHHLQMRQTDWEWS